MSVAAILRSHWFGLLLLLPGLAIGSFQDWLDVPHCFLLPSVDYPIYLYMAKHGLMVTTLYLGSAGFFVHTLLIARSSRGVYFLKFAFLAMYWVGVLLLSFL